MTGEAGKVQIFLFCARLSRCDYIDIAAIIRQTCGSRAYRAGYDHGYSCAGLDKSTLAVPLDVYTSYGGSRAPIRHSHADGDLYGTCVLDVDGFRVPLAGAHVSPFDWNIRARKVLISKHLYSVDDYITRADYSYPICHSRVGYWDKCYKKECYKNAFA